METEHKQVLQSGQWRGLVPIMQLVLCLAQDNIKVSYFWCAKVMSRQILNGHQLDLKWTMSLLLVAGMI
jgi:hypothetical protein